MAKLVDRWRIAKSQYYQSPDIQRIFDICADELEALATAPPEQARCPDCDEAAKHAYSDATTPGFFYSKCERHRKQPQAASAGALIEQITNYLSSGGLFNPEAANHNAVRDLLIDCREALLPHAAHDQKVRAGGCAFCDAGDAPLGHLYHLTQEGRPNCGYCACAECAAPAASKPASEGEVNEQNS